MKNHRIVVVEDEAIVAMDIEDRLTALGYQVAGRAASGEQALELTSAQHPDLILMDIRLEGGSDGIATARKIRQHFHLPVIFLTAYSEDETLERAKLAEPFGYLLKPFEDQELKSAIEIALYKHQAEEEIRRLNRLFNVLSQVNQAVVHSRSREELLSVVCRLLVERGEVDLAWIGWLDSATSQIKPVAQHGRHQEILTQADFYADGRPEGQGNPGKAIREGKPFICLTCPDEACLYPAENQAHRFGFHACGSFPLRLGGEVCGVLNIGVAEPKFFGDRETELLQEVAQDISLALDKQESDSRRDQAEKALKDSETRYRRIVETATEGIWAMDADYRTNYVNKNMAAMLGYLPEEMVGQVVAAFMFPEDQEQHEQKMARCRQGHGDKYERRFRRKDGLDLWTSVSATALMDEHGNFQGSFGMFIDITERKRLEEAVRYNEQFLTDIFNCIQDGLSILDRDLNIIRFNAKMATVPNLNPEIGKKCYEAYHGRSESCEICPVQTTLRTGEIAEKILEIPQVDGSTMYVEIYTFPLLNRQTSQVEGVIEQVRDVSERKKMEAALRESESRVKAKLTAILAPTGDIGQLELGDIIDTQAIQALMDDFFQLTRLTMAIIDLKGKVLVGIGWQDICSQFHRRHPLTRQRCLESDIELSRSVAPGTFKLYKCKNNLWDIVTPIMVGGKHLGNLFMGQFFFEDDALDLDFYRSQARQFSFDEAEYLAALARVPRWSRQTINTAMSFFSKLANMISMLCHSNIKLARSIAEQEDLLEVLRANEEKIRGDEQFLNDIFSSIKDGLCILDLYRNVVRVNPAIKNFVHTPPIEGRKCYKVFRNRNEPCENCPVEHTLQTGEANQGVLEINYGGNDTTFIEINSYPFINRDGQLAGVIEYVRDITEVKKAEETLKEMERQLLQAQKMEAIGTLAGGIAHDFNNILWAIMGYAEMASYNLLNTEMARQYLDQVLKASQRAKNLVGQILAFSRRLESKKKPLYLKNIAQEALNLLRASLPATIEIRPRLQSESSILADPTQMSQVIMNLATNAFHAMEKTGGVLTLTLEDLRVEQPLAAVHGELAPGAYVRLQLQDTGTGIEPAVVSRIFEPYFTTKEVGKGTGLGLATVLGIVKSHDGEICLESRPTQGTVFTVYFPVIDQQPDHPLQAEAILPKSAGRILFIDDEPSLAELGKAALSRLGYDVRAFTNSREALATFEASPQDIDLVITDLTMPHFTGLDLTKRFQALRPDMPIIICTGYTELLKPEEVKSLGIREVLTKPLGLTQLAETVKQALQADLA